MTSPARKSAITFALAGSLMAMPAALCAQAADEGVADGAASTSIERPETNSSGVFVTQIGATNRATVVQNRPTQYAQVVQQGEGNTVEASQRDNGDQFAQIVQNGQDNTALLTQSGTGSTTLLLGQEGNRNRLDLFQNDSSLAGSAAVLLQRGNDNTIALSQDGGDNQVNLSQEGNGNAMNVIQENSGNRLTWTQIGDGLSQPQVVQGGNQVIEITQTNTGAIPPSSGN